MKLTRRQCLSALPFAPAMLAQSPTIYDLLLKGGQVIDPKNGRTGRLDIAVVGDKITRVAPNLPVAHARLVVNVGDYHVTPGLIDLHAHVDGEGTDRNVQPDHHALSNGVTTVVDMGGAGAKSFEGFHSRTARRSRTRILAWLNNTEGDPGPLLKKYQAVIVGMAAPTSLGVPAIAEGGLEVLDQLRPGDVFTQVYGSPAPALTALLAARKRGVLFDTGSFWFRVAAPSIQKGFLPDTISTDIQKETILLPRANMMTTMSKFLNLGLTLDQLIERTTVNPARAIRRPELGQLAEGGVADIVVLETVQGKFGFVDAGHARHSGDRRLRCVLTVRAGRVVWDSEGLSMTEWTHAGPYSNFK